MFTPAYACPKFLQTCVFDAKSKVFSFGVVMGELITGRLQNISGEFMQEFFIENEMEEIIVYSRAGEWQFDCLNKLKRLVKQCLKPYRSRIDTMVAVMSQLIEIEK